MYFIIYLVFNFKYLNSEDEWTTYDDQISIVKLEISDLIFNFLIQDTFNFLIS
jgi:hypothetical protein